MHNERAELILNNLSKCFDSFAKSLFRCQFWREKKLTTWRGLGAPPYTLAASHVSMCVHTQAEQLTCFSLLQLLLGWEGDEINWCQDTGGNAQGDTLKKKPTTMSRRSSVSDVAIYSCDLYRQLICSPCQYGWFHESTTLFGKERERERAPL